MIPIIPVPRSIEMSSRRFSTTGTVTISHSAELKGEAEFLRAGLSRLSQIDVAFVKDSPSVRLGMRDGIEDEGYELSVTESGVEIWSASASGAFYGVQTLLAASETDGGRFSVPCMSVNDAPRFSWRGLHLDVGRHMFPVADIKDLLDRMAELKLNRFHWHLTEDQGWRIAIDRYPALTEIGSKRIGPDGPYEGFYTKDDVKEVIAHAGARHIEVIPEIEMPGHTQAVLAAYPELACTEGPFDVMDSWGISKEVFCAGNDAVFEFLYNVLDEIVELFPSRYIHIGGDECPKDRWSACDRCTERIAHEGLADVHELQSWFIKRVESYLLKKGKSIIGWDEILEGGLAPTAAVMSWRGSEGGVAAAKDAHPVVMSPTEFCYFDYPQTSDPGEPGPGHFSTPVISTKKVYEFEPIPPALSPEESRHVLGAQANLWTESIPSTERLQYMTFPRLCALAEVVWSSAETRNWNDFSQRLGVQIERYKALGVNACADPAKWG